MRIAAAVLSPLFLVAAYTAALAANPQDWHLHHLYGMFALEQRDFEKASEQFAFEVNIFPDRLAGRLGYASALARAGRRSQAIAQINEALRIDPGNSSAKKALSWLHSQ